MQGTRGERLLRTNAVEWTGKVEIKIKKTNPGNRRSRLKKVALISASEVPHYRKGGRGRRVVCLKKKSERKETNSHALSKVIHLVD